MKGEPMVSTTTGGKAYRVIPSYNTQYVTEVIDLYNKKEIPYIITTAKEEAGQTRNSAASAV
jgi:ribosomal protein L7Ae-like RNA K-turn-binding protein